ncbi:FtsX-like permease family protein [Mesoterricola sediminis]|uniref:ABC transporter permease n=1 Tax=Mesoterricola sediminis TaxID=2927980 RepID=A0AA48H259_9BACT|nr:FtsX-like permease family protein [Mesoterricola sediminis]BDU76096.1 ABC transporter permease [Mesoterricola sediminis]
MKGLAGRLVLRPLALAPARAALAVLTVALGVAAFLAIRLANRAAIASFDAFTRGVGTGAEYVVRAPFGDLDERRLSALAPLRRDLWIRPVLEGSFSREPDFAAFQILATDLVGLGGEGGDGAGLPDLGGALVSPRLGLAPGAALPGLVDGRRVTLRVAGLLPESPGRPAPPPTLLVLDLPAGQALLGRPGRLDRLDLGPWPGRTPSREAIAAHLPDGWVLEDAEQRASSGRAMSGAFRLNLTVLSLIALAVGAYLLFQAFDAAVNRRRETWALLAALGCPPRRILRFVLLEAALLGSLGSLLGIGLGWAGAQGAVRFVARTLEALYGAASARHAALGPGEAAAALVLGTLTCLAAAWIPARRAAATPPVQLLARGAAARPMAWAPLALGGAALLAAGLALAFLPRLPQGTLWHAYLGSALVIFGGSLASVALLPALGALGRLVRDWRARLALRPLALPTGRHGFAAAAMAVAIGMTVGMGVMVRSFEATVEGWIGDSLRADVYVAPLGAGGAGSRHRIPEADAAALAADPAVAAVDRYQAVPFLFRGRPTTLAAGDFAVLGTRGHLPMVAGGASREVLARIRRDGLADPGAVASETFARRFGVRPGDRLDLGAGRRLTLRGVYGDYGNERGSLILDRPVFQAWTGEARAASLALYLRPGEDAEAFAAREARARPGLLLRSNRALRTQVERIFHQTFAITYALEVIGLAVALAGLVQSMAGLALERRGDLLTLRALGAGDAPVAAVLLGEGCGVAAAGVLGGLGLGLALARILVSVLNPQAFGWTLAFRLPWGALAGLTGLCLAAAALAQWPVALRAARLPVDRQAEEGAT